MATQAVLAMVTIIAAIPRAARIPRFRNLVMSSARLSTADVPHSAVWLQDSHDYLQTSDPFPACKLPSRPTHSPTSDYIALQV